MSHIQLSSPLLCHLISSHLVCPSLHSVVKRWATTTPTTTTKGGTRANRLRLQGSRCQTNLTYTLPLSLFSSPLLSSPIPPLIPTRAMFPSYLFILLTLVLTVTSVSVLVDGSSSSSSNSFQLNPAATTIELNFPKNTLLTPEALAQQQFSDRSITKLYGTSITVSSE